MEKESLVEFLSRSLSSPMNAFPTEGSRKPIMPVIVPKWSQRKPYLNVVVNRDAGPRLAEQFDQALTCLDDLSKNCKGLWNFAKKRLAIEKEYANKLHKLATSALDACLTPKGTQFQGGLGPAWHCILKATQECADAKLRTTATLEQSILPCLSSVFDGELHKNKKELASEGHQSSKALHDVSQSLGKAQAAYNSSATDWQSCLLQLHRECGGEWRTSESTKLREREAILSRKCEEAKEHYSLCIRQANNMQHLHHFEHMPPLLAQLSELSEDVVMVTRQSLLQLLQQTDLLQRSLAEQTARIPTTPLITTLRSIDPKSYTNDFIFCHMTSDMVQPPRPFVFEEFLMQDEAATLHFQKSKQEFERLFPNTSTLEAQVARQIDKDGFTVTSEELSEVVESDRGEVYKHFSFVEEAPPVPNNRSSVMYMLALRKAVMKQRKPGEADGSETAGSGLPSWFPRRTVQDNGTERSGSPAPSAGGKPTFFSRRNVTEDRTTSWYVDDGKTACSSTSLARQKSTDDLPKSEKPPIPPRPSGAAMPTRLMRPASTNRAPQPVSIPFDNGEQIYAEPLPCTRGSPHIERPLSDGYLVPLPFLVQSCMTYLETPRALKEEGLFRVPGDVTRIRHLKAAFDTLEQKEVNLLNGRALANFLREEMSKEPDPNTIAGLLKMYLREQTFVKAETCKEIVSGLYGRQRDRTVSNPTVDLDLLQIALQQQVPQVRAEEAPQRAEELRGIMNKHVSSKARAVLGSVCKLLSEVAKNSTENRMTVHSLGMCCGLSVFPAMSTGHAASVLRFLIEHWRLIFPEIET